MQINCQLGETLDFHKFVLKKIIYSIYQFVKKKKKKKSNG